MQYDFDTIIDRSSTDSCKYDLRAENGFSDDALCYWVADMDFKCAPEIISALKEKVEHGIFGYTALRKPYYNAVRRWILQHTGYEVHDKWLFTTAGVVQGISFAIQAFSEKGDSILIQKPIYYPFSRAIEENGRVIVNSPLVWDGEKYNINFNDFERKIADNKVKMFLLCNPHNPSGRVWGKDELEKIAEICLRYGVTVVSDEIHCDFVWEPYKHTPFASLSKEAENICVTCTSASKTFNLAGLQTSNIFVANGDMRIKYAKVLKAASVSLPNMMGLTATLAAYTYGEPWLCAVKEYIEANFERTIDFFSSHKSKIRALKPQGTYLQWLDCKELCKEKGWSDEELNKAIKEAGVWLDAGSMFGDEANFFQRINVACPWEYLKQGLERLLSLQAQAQPVL